MTTLTKGRFGETNVFNEFIPQNAPDGSIWDSWQKTTGLSDVYLQSIVWSPGGEGAGLKIPRRYSPKHNPRHNLIFCRQLIKSGA